MASYVKPQVQVFQEFQQLPTDVIENLNAFVFGPNYQLFRYATESEKASIGLGAYDKDTGTDYSYPDQPAGSIVDQDYVKLYMETVWAEYLSISSSSANPVVAISENERNKLRAAPVIGTAENTNLDSAIIDATGGYFYGNVALPEYYYFYPYGGYDTGTSAWSADKYSSDLDVLQAAKFKYITSEGVTGTVDIPSSSNPFGAGEYIHGPDGLRLDLDAGGVDGVLTEPLTIRFSEGTSPNWSYFEMTLSPDQIGQMIDWDLDESKSISISVDLGALTKSVTWDATPHHLDIASGGTYPYTVATLKDALEADSDIATYFDMGDIVEEGTGDSTTGVVDAAVYPTNSSTTDVTSASGMTDFELLPVGHRLQITANPYTFKTANGYARSAHFKNRDVQVGDRLTYEVTDASSTAHAGETKVVGLEADQSLAVVGDPSVDTNNSATQSGDNLSAGLDIITAGSDNQRSFDNGTALRSLSVLAGVTDNYYSGSLMNGIIDDTFTVTITTSGPAGTAQGSISTASGIYSRDNVPIEASGLDDGRMYIGHNMYINFVQGTGDADANFKSGDTYTFSRDVERDFTAVGTAKVSSSGAYTGTGDTTYVLKVTRGGRFDRSVNIIEGIQASGVTLTDNTSFSNWTGGDVDDEYILKCTTAGTESTAVFELKSRLGDNESNVQFNGTGSVNSLEIGGNGLEVYLAGAGAFSVGDYYVIQVYAARPQIRITDTAGVDDSSTVTVNDAVSFDVGDNGIAATFSSNTISGLLKGDIFYIAATAESDAAVKTLVLADDMPEEVTEGLTVADVANISPSNFGVSLYLVQSSAQIEGKKTQSAPDYNWETDSDSITVNSGIQVQDSSWYEDDGTLPYLDIYKADMYVEYRALLTGLADTIHSIDDINDVATDLGTVTLDNPLAQGVYNALSNSGGQPVYYMAIPTDNAAGYDTVLNAASLTDDVYGFAPLTRDESILNTIEAHINALSTETEKRWRIAFVGTEMATNVAVYNLANNPYSEEYYATVEDDPDVSGNQYTLVKLWRADGTTPAPTSVLSDLVVGDNLRISFSTDAWGDATYATYDIASLETDTSVKLSSGPAAPISVATKAEAWHDYSVAEMATAVAAKSAGFADRRTYHVFPDSLGAYGVTQTSPFGAAAVAGLVSSVPPQQGLTNVELNGFDDIPMVYGTFNYTQLNTMAASGTLIIMQDVAGGRVYVRHQVSTNTLAGNLNTTELSITKNLDSISYYFAGVLEPFIGQYNVTPELLDVLRTQVADGLLYLGSFTSIGLLGPQVLLENTEIQSVEQHPTLADQVVINVNIQLPPPLNVVQLHLVV